jgi:Rieske Fe-S protein
MSHDLIPQLMNDQTPSTDLSRRQIIKQFSLCTAASIIGGQLWTGRVLASIGTGGNVGVIKIKLSDYPALQSDYGSVQFRFNNGAVGTYYPFTLTRAPGNVFHAVDTRCTHEGTVVGPFSGGSSGFMECPNHFSQFDIAGKVTLGPAETDLACYATSFNSSTGVISVEVPALYTSISTVSVQSTTASTIRLRLQFRTLNSTFTYRVQYQQTLSDAPAFVTFATSATGNASSSQIAGNSGTRTIFVDATGTTGFFAVALIVNPL